MVRGYVSKIDKSVQPYGLVVPPSYSPTAPHRWRLDAWFHGRDEALSEVNFLTGRQRSPGEFTPRDTIVLHLYGRFCNANRFAGEVDFFEALDDVKRHYAIDENRILVRGFSMGGASAWGFGTHYAGLWAAVAPGAGFSETEEFLKLKEMPPEWEQKLWHLYDAADYAANLYNVPTVAYHGEIDPQKQAGDVMEHAMAAEGMRLVRIMGPQTPHRYHPDSKVEIDRILDTVAERGRDAYPRKVSFTTWTLAYNRMKWVAIDALGQALGARAPGCRNRRRFGRDGHHLQRHGLHAGDGPGRLPARSRPPARRHHRRPETGRARSRQRPLLGGALPQVRRAVDARR